MHAAPQSCSALGLSPSSTIPSTTEPTGWIVRIIDVSAAGRRGSEIEISSQPSTWELSASRISQPADGHAGARSSTRSSSATTSDADRGDPGRVEQRSGRPPRVRVAVAEDQDEAGVGGRGQRPEQHAAQRVRAVGAVLEHARDQDDADQRQRQRGQDPLRRAPRRAPPRRRTARSRPAGSRARSRARRRRRRSPGARRSGRRRRTGPRSAPAAAGRARAGRSGGARARRAARARATRRRSGRTPPWQGGRAASWTRIAENAIVSAPASAISGAGPSPDAGLGSSDRGHRQASPGKPKHAVPTRRNPSRSYMPRDVVAGGREEHDRRRRARARPAPAAR